MLFHLPFSNLRSHHYSFSHFKNAEFLALFHSNLTNSDRITNSRMGGERASKTSYLKYILYLDTITPQILNRSQSSEFVNMRLCSMINLAKKPRVYVWSAYQPHQNTVVRFFGPIWNRSKSLSWSKPGPLTGYPDLLLTLIAAFSGETVEVMYLTPIWWCGATDRQQFFVRILGNQGIVWTCDLIT